MAPKKRKYFHNKKLKKAKKILSSDTFNDSDSLVLATCSVGHEKDCIKELIDIFNQYSEILIPCKDEKSVSPSSEIYSDNLSLAECLYEEIKTPKKFTVSSFADIKGNILIKCLDPHINVIELVWSILNHIYLNKELISRYTIRLIPLRYISRSTLRNITNLAHLHVEPFFKNLSKPTNWSIVYRCRHLSNINRDEVINTIAQYTNGHPVNINHPTVVIIVEILGPIVGMSIIKDYTKFSQYNIRKILEQKEQKLDVIDNESIKNK